MRILAVDTSTRACGVAVVEDKRLVAQSFTRSAENYSGWFFTEVDEVLEEAGTTMPDFGAFAVSVGPGSFTGLRIGLTAVKGWAEVYQKPIAGVSSQEAIAVQARGVGEYVASFFDARRGQIFGGVFQRSGEKLVQVGDDVVMSAEEFLGELVSRIDASSEEWHQNSSIVFASPEPDLLRGALDLSQFRDSAVEKVSEDLAPWIGNLAFDYVRRNELVDALSLDANYVRRTDAERYWKGAK
jgi:tRNA threonylcarbamoyl adenosine modification protein YeaZ